MKKFTLFLGALLISMVSMAAEATISFADVANRKTLTNDQQVWEQNGLIVTGNKSASTTNVADYSNPARFYQGSSLTIKCTLGNITKIVIDGNPAKPVEAIQTSIGEEATIDGNIVTVIPKNQTSDTYVIEKFSAQVRINAITVTYTGNGETPDDGGEEPETPDTPEEPETPEVETVGDGTEANPFTVEDVIALNNTLSGKHYVKAYIVGQAVGQSFVDGLDTEAPFVAAEGSTQGTNLAIASSLTAEVANMIPVQLPKGALRNDFNLVENPDKLGAQVLICGDLIKYFNLPGIKNTTSIVVVGETPDDGGETPEVTTDTITCAEAATIAAAENYVGTDTVTVVGYVTELGSAKDDGSKQCFYMADTKDGGKVFMAYWAFVSKLYVVGDKVAVTGILKNFNGTIEIADGQSALLEAAAGETPDDGGETPDDDGETPANVTFDFTTEDGLEALGIAYPTTDAGNGAYATDLEEGKAYSQNGISLAAKYGSTATRIWLAANGKLDLRHYKGGVLTFAAPAGKVITNIVFDGADVSGLTTLVDKAWTGNASTVEIPAAADAKTIKINTITVHVADASSDYVATPVISGEADFMDNTTVTITAEEGLEVYYTLDGTDPTNASIKYTAPFELTATTTVKAIAYNGDKASAVVEKKFTKMTILTCAEAVALCTNPATPGQHIIRGYVTEMIEAYNDQYKNITFWMADTPDGGQVLQAFRVKPVSDVEQALKVGDFVEVIGSLILYTKDGVSIPEVNAGGSVKLITAGNTAVDNVTVNQQTTKFIENGQLIIVKNGVRYNVIGQVTK